MNDGKCVFVKLKENHIILTDQIYKDTPIGQNTDSRHCVNINSTRLMEENGVNDRKKEPPFIHVIIFSPLIVWD